MNQPSHILNKLGILSSFSIARRISEEDIQKFFVKHIKKGKTTEEVHKLFLEKIESDILEAIETGTIPGIINENRPDLNNISSQLAAKLPAINKLIVFIAHRIMCMKFDKMSMCYIIDTLVNLLNLTDDDFQTYHGLNNGEDGDDDDDDNSIA